MSSPQPNRGGAFAGVGQAYGGIGGGGAFNMANTPGTNATKPGIVQLRPTRNVKNYPDKKPEAPLAPIPKEQKRTPASNEPLGRRKSARGSGIGDLPITRVSLRDNTVTTEYEAVHEPNLPGRASMVGRGSSMIQTGRSSMVVTPGRSSMRMAGGEGRVSQIGGGRASVRFGDVAIKPMIVAEINSKMSNFSDSSSEEEDIREDYKKDREKRKAAGKKKGTGKKKAKRKSTSGDGTGAKKRKSGIGPPAGAVVNQTSKSAQNTVSAYSTTLSNQASNISPQVGNISPGASTPVIGPPPGAVVNQTSKSAQNTVSANSTTVSNQASNINARSSNVSRSTSASGSSGKEGAHEIKEYPDKDHKLKGEGVKSLPPPPRKSSESFKSDETIDFGEDNDERKEEATKNPVSGGSKNDPKIGDGRDSRSDSKSGMQTSSKGPISTASGREAKSLISAQGNAIKQIVLDHYWNQMMNSEKSFVFEGDVSSNLSSSMGSLAGPGEAGPTRHSNERNSANELAPDGQLGDVASGKKNKVVGSTDVEDDDASSTKKKCLPTWAIILIVLSIIVLLGGAAGIVVWQTGKDDAKAGQPGPPGAVSGTSDPTAKRKDPEEEHEEPDTRPKANYPIRRRGEAAASSDKNDKKDDGDETEVCGHSDAACGMAGATGDHHGEAGVEPGTEAGPKPVTSAKMAKRIRMRAKRKRKSKVHAVPKAKPECVAVSLTPEVTIDEAGFEAQEVTEDAATDALLNSIAMDDADIESDDADIAMDHDPDIAVSTAISNGKENRVQVGVSSSSASPSSNSFFTDDPHCCALGTCAHPVSKCGAQEIAWFQQLEGETVIEDPGTHAVRDPYTLAMHAGYTAETRKTDIQLEAPGEISKCYQLLLDDEDGIATVRNGFAYLYEDVIAANRLAFDKKIYPGVTPGALFKSEFYNSEGFSVHQMELFQEQSNGPVNGAHDLMMEGVTERNLIDETITRAKEMEKTPFQDSYRGLRNGYRPPPSVLAAMCPPLSTHILALAQRIAGDQMRLHESLVLGIAEGTDSIVAFDEDVQKAMGDGIGGMNQGSFLDESMVRLRKASWNGSSLDKSTVSAFVERAWDMFAGLTGRVANSDSSGSFLRATQQPSKGNGFPAERSANSFVAEAVNQNGASKSFLTVATRVSNRNRVSHQHRVLVGKQSMEADKETTLKAYLQNWIALYSVIEGCGRRERNPCMQGAIGSDYSDLPHGGQKDESKGIWKGLSGLLQTHVELMYRHGVERKRVEIENLDGGMSLSYTAPGKGSDVNHINDEHIDITMDAKEAIGEAARDSGELSAFGAQCGVVPPAGERCASSFLVVARNSHEFLAEKNAAAAPGVRCIARRKRLLGGKTLLQTKTQEEIAVKNEEQGKTTLTETEDINFRLGRQYEISVINRKTVQVAGNGEATTVLWICGDGLTQSVQYGPLTVNLTGDEIPDPPERPFQILQKTCLPEPEGFGSGEGRPQVAFEVPLQTVFKTHRMVPVDVEKIDGFKAFLSDEKYGLGRVMKDLVMPVIRLDKNKWRCSIIPRSTKYGKKIQNFRTGILRSEGHYTAPYKTVSSPVAGR